MLLSNPTCSHLFLLKITVVFHPFKNNYGSSWVFYHLSVELKHVENKILIFKVTIKGIFRLFYSIRKEISKIKVIAILKVGRRHDQANDEIMYIFPVVLWKCWISHDNLFIMQNEIRYHSSSKSGKPKCNQGYKKKTQPFSWPSYGKIFKQNVKSCDSYYIL